MAHSWARDSKVRINSKQMGAGMEAQTVLPSCCDLEELNVQQAFASCKCFSILLVSEREAVEIHGLLPSLSTLWYSRKAPRETGFFNIKGRPVPSGGCWSAFSSAQLVHVAAYFGRFHSSH